MAEQASPPVERVLDRLEEYQERRGEFRARCPAHQGNSDNSLSITEGNDGRALLTCHAGCEKREIVDALGLSMVDLFNHSSSTNGSSAKKSTRKITKKTADDQVLTTEDLPDGTYWEFTTPVGEVLYIQRHKREYYQKISEGLWKKGLAGVSQVLYNLHELVGGVHAGKTIYHLEGPKD